MQTDMPDQPAMRDDGDPVTEWAQAAATFPQLKAYGVSADGTRQQLDCDAIVIELDGERGLIVSLSERRAGEGVAICSLPRAEQPSLSSDPQEAELSPTNASQYPLQIPHLPINTLSLNSFFRPTPWFTGAILASVVAPALPGSAATFLVNKSFWGNHSNEGTFSWAIHQSNITPGKGEVVLANDVSIDDHIAGATAGIYAAEFTDHAGVDIYGNGHQLTGNHRSLISMVFFVPRPSLLVGPIRPGRQIMRKDNS